MFWRYLAKELKQCSGKPYVQILFGARQTGKTTLLRQIFPDSSLWIDLSDPGQRTRYLAHPQEFVAECRALPAGEKPHLVVIDEAQAVPPLFDAVQSLYDSEKTRWRFVLCGSSARKLRATGANLLPGRSMYHHLYSLLSLERKFKVPGIRVAERSKNTLNLLLKIPENKPGSSRFFPPVDLETRLTFGDLPGIAIAEEDDRPRILASYSVIYLEEEIRREGLIKDWGAFTRFLQLAASESGQIINFSGLSRESGVSVPTVKSYYQLLEDMFIGFRVPAFSKSPRKFLLSTPKFFFFDIGVRHAAAGLAPERSIVKANPGPFFEQWVAQELWKRLGYLKRGRLFHYRTKGGAEIDFILEINDHFIPVEVKWTEHPKESDARHCIEFMRDFPKKSQEGYIICRCSRPMQIYEKIRAIPYWSL
ncbi:MAG TPA: ATP-binding protein [Thermodesulfobacteriota bacterium]|nr:ATP-binding protein [Thermodesulfobacteriota bacterium]